MIMKGRKGKQKPPSRQKYEQENPTISFRLPKALKERLIRYLSAAGQSFADFVKSILDNEEALVKERVNALVKKRFGVIEKRLDQIESVIWEVMFTLEDNNLEIFCPRCIKHGGCKLFLAKGYQIEPDGDPLIISTWKCPICGWYLDFKGRIDPNSLKWADAKAAIAELVCRRTSQK